MRINVPFNPNRQRNQRPSNSDGSFDQTLKTLNAAQSQKREVPVKTITPPVSEIGQSVQSQNEQARVSMLGPWVSKNGQHSARIIPKGTPGWVEIQIPGWGPVEAHVREDGTAIGEYRGVTFFTWRRDDMLYLDRVDRRNGNYSWPRMTMRQTELTETHFNDFARQNLIEAGGRNDAGRVWLQLKGRNDIMMVAPDHADTVNNNLKRLFGAGENRRNGEGQPPGGTNGPDGATNGKQAPNVPDNGFAGVYKIWDYDGGGAEAQISMNKGGSTMTATVKREDGSFVRFEGLVRREANGESEFNGKSGPRYGFVWTTGESTRIYRMDPDGHFIRQESAERAGTIAIWEGQKPDGTRTASGIDVKLTDQRAQYHAKPLEKTTSDIEDGDKINTAHNARPTSQPGQGTNNAPGQIGAVPLSNVQPGQSATIDLDHIFRDADGHTLTYNVEGLPSGWQFKIDGDALTITVPQDAETGNVPFTITADDGNGGTAEAVGGIRVVPTETPQPGEGGNRPPTVSQGRWASLDADLYAGMHRVFQLEKIFSDPDGDTLTFSVQGLPDGWQWEITPDGKRLIIDTPQDAEIGQHRFTVTATDSEGNQASKDGTITINNRPPVKLSENHIPRRMVRGEPPRTEDASRYFRDNDGPQSLTYSLIGAPDWVTIDEKTGIITFAPPEDAVGDHFVFAVRAYDGNRASDPFGMTVQLRNPN